MDSTSEGGITNGDLIGSYANYWSWNSLDGTAAWYRREVGEGGPVWGSAGDIAEAALNRSYHTL